MRFATVDDLSYLSRDELAARLAEALSDAEAERRKREELEARFEKLDSAYRTVQEQLALLQRRIFVARAERVDNNELLPAPAGAAHAPAFTVGKVSLGAIHDWPAGEHLLVGLGGLYALNVLPSGLKSAYGAREPHGTMMFLRLKLR